MQQLAQLNVARMKYAFDDPKMQEFIDRLEDINALADHAPGIVWRLQEEAAKRLDQLRQQGPGAQAFTFKQSFPAA